MFCLRPDGSAGGGATNAYLPIACTAVRRLLGACNRSPLHRESGSLCRDAWHYRFPARFHPATLQCAAYAFGRLYLLDDPSNPFFRNDRLFEALAASVAFTRTLQNRDGSFSEWYPGQASYCATSYLAAYFAMILPALGAETAARHRPWLFRAGRWIARRPAAESSNQLAAAACALSHLATWDGGAGFRRAADEAVAALLGRQHAEGWFPEYGAADPGYQGLALDFLARIDGLSPSRRTGEGLARGLEFLRATVMPDGTVPALCASRGANFLAPFSLERLADRWPAAAALRERCLRGIGTGAVPTPLTVDDRYSAHLLLPSYVDAARVAPAQSQPPVAAGAERAPRIASLPGAGTASAGFGGFHAVVAAGRGGAWHALFEGDPAPALYDAGYLVRAGRRWISSAQASESRIDAGRGGALTVESWGRGGVVPRLSVAPQRPARSVALAGGAAAGALGLAGAWERLLKSAAFGAMRPSSLEFRRRVSVRADGIATEDTIRNPARRPVDELVAARLPLPSPQPASLFFASGDFGRCAGLGAREGRRAAERLSANGEVRIATFVGRSGGAWEISWEVDGEPAAAERLVF